MGPTHACILTIPIINFVFRSERGAHVEIMHLNDIYHVYVISTCTQGRSQPWLSGGGGKVGELPGGALAPIARSRAQGGVWRGMCPPEKLEDFGILILNSRNLVITFTQNSFH